jgi:iron(III) transport system ATP-binding protein
MIVVSRLRKVFADGIRLALDGVSFTVAKGQVHTLLGPSGCGKTTSLRCVAGLERPDGGEIILGARTVFSSSKRINVGPDARNLGMVFQSYAVWPHMTVAENVVYPLRARGISSSETNRRLARALEIAGLSALRDRPSPNLSGGQQQRVALARAIVSEPEVLLLDEPLSNLDAKLREQMRHELASLQKRLGYTMLYVTHDQEEALALSQRVSLMRDGVIVEEGEPAEMYRKPRHPFTAAFLGNANFVACTLSGVPRDGDAVEVETVFGRFGGIARKGEAGSPKLFFRPHHVQLARPGEPGDGTATVLRATFFGEGSELVLGRDQDSFCIRTQDETLPEVGAEVGFRIRRAGCVVFVAEARAA